MSLQGLGDKARALVESWKVPGAVALALLGSAWYAVTRADDLMRKADRVPAIEEAILQMKINEEIAGRRLDTLERAQAASEKRAERQNAEISDKLDRLLEHRDGR